MRRRELVARFSDGVIMTADLSAKPPTYVDSRLRLNGTLEVIGTGRLIEGVAFAREQDHGEKKSRKT